MDQVRAVYVLDFQYFGKIQKYIRVNQSNYNDSTHKKICS